ncbi:MAG: hypothetical protein VR73_13385 [Gammaproteobacteria bacterium BRH_c0]|nr:MAG: hypothetical protein VR73_13385 [Gammaproteobacteria bacterium BRH_c0]
MNALLAWFVKNPVAANLLMLIIIGAGFASISGIDNEFFPDIQPNIVRVDVPYPGAGPLEVEEQICIKIEEAISDVQGIKEVKSTASQGMGSVNIETVEGWDIQRMVNDVKSRVDAISTFPVDSERPIVSDLSFGSPVVDLVVFGGHDEQAIKNLALSLKDELNQLPGVSQVRVGGTRKSVVSVEIPENVLLAYGLSFGDISAVIRDSSLNLPAGQMRNRTGDIQLQIYGQDYDAQDFENIVVVSQRDGSQVKLGQIATITDTFEEKNFLVEYEGQIAAQLTVLVGENPDTIGTAAVVREFMAERKDTLPAGFKLEMWNDSSFYLKDRLNLLMINSLQGLALVFILLLLFLRPLLAIWVSTGIAVAYLGTLATMTMMGVSINVVSTFAFLLILGIVVDDAIVISENIYSMHERKMRGPMAAIAGVTGIAKPVVLAVLTTLIVFVPMLFMPGNRAQLFAPIPAVAIAALTFSIIESLFILPSHLSHLKEEKPPGNVFTRSLLQVRRKFTHGLNYFSFRIYQPALDYSIRMRGATLALFLAVLMICISTFIGGWLQLQLTPEVESENLIAEAQFQEGAGFAHVLAVKNRMIAGLEEVRHQKDVVGFDGQPAITNSFLVVDGDKVTLRINLIKNGDRSITSSDIEQRLKAAIGEIKGVKSFNVSSSMFGLRKDISFRLSGSDIAELEAASAYLKGILAGYGGVTDITDSQSSARQEIRIALKPNAANLGLQLSDVARQVRYAFYGAEAQRIPRLREDVRVMVRYPAEHRSSLEFLQDMRIHLADGRSVPFMEVATAEFVPGYTTLNRTDRQRVVSVYADVIHGAVAPGEIVQQVTLNHRADINKRFPSVTLGLEGEQQEQGEFFSTMVLGAVFALFCMYALLAIEFKSYLQPLYVLSAVPFGAAGAVIGHLVMGMDFSIPSVLGVLATAGVVVNGNLVLIDCINRLRDEGLDIVAAVKQGARERLRPILLTSITTFFGLMPILLEPSTSAAALKPVVVSLSFGVVFATTITLLMVPALYVVFEGIKERLGFRQRAEAELA